MARKDEKAGFDELLSLAKSRVKDKERAALGNDPVLKLETIPMDIPAFDAILGGGWRRGRMGMVIGAESMGKTLILQWTIAAFQSRGLTCGFIDPEKTYDPEWFASTGVDVDRLVVARPSSTEQAFDLASDWVKAGIDLVAIDSLASLTPKMRAEHTLEEREVVGLHARKIGEGLNQLNNDNVNSFILCTNQLRSKVGVVYGTPDTVPGGRAQRFYASYILHVRRAGWKKEGDKRIGYHLKVQTEKNKTTMPLQEASVPFLFSGVIDTIGGLVETAKEMGVVPAKAGFYKWDGETIRGLPAFKEWLTKNEESRKRLEEAVNKAIQEEPDFGEETPVDDDEGEYNLDGEE